MALFITFHIIICVFLVCVILLQPGKADGGIGFGGSSSQSVFGSRGAGNFLTKTTGVCAFIFLATSFLLTRSRIQEYTRSVIGKEPVSSSPAKPSTPPPASKAGASNATPANAGAQKAGTDKDQGAINGSTGAKAGGAAAGATAPAAGSQSAKATAPTTPAKK